MSRNLLWSEYEDLLADVIKRWPDVRQYRSYEATRQGLTGTVSATLDVQRTGRARGMVPRVSIGSSSGVTGDPLTALTKLEDARQTILAATTALALLGDVVVWLDEAPCDHCGGRGHHHDRSPCRSCKGIGKRTEPKED